MLLAACQGGDPDEPDAKGERVSGCDRFVLFENEDWDLREAIDRQPEDAALPGDPDLDWYSEFERFVPSSDDLTEGVSLVISGHAVAADELRRQLTNVELRKHPDQPDLLVGSSTDGPSSVVLKPLSATYTLRLLSYGLDVDELVEVTDETRPVCEEEWVQSQPPLE